MTNLFTILFVLLALLSLAFCAITLVLYSNNAKTFQPLTLHLMHSGRTRFSKPSPRSLVIYDVTIRLFEIFFSVTALFITLPLTLIYLLLLYLSHAGHLLSNYSVIGKNGNPITVYRFSSSDSSEQSLFILRKALEYLNKLGIPELPILWNVLRHDLSLFGLSRIPYSRLDHINQHYPPLLEQYKSYRPGLVSLATITLSELSHIKDSTVYYDRLHFLNATFMDRRSFKLFLNMLKATIILALTPRE